MTSGEVLRHSVSIDEQEVFSLIHKPVELLFIWRQRHCRQLHRGGRAAAD